MTDLEERLRDSLTAAAAGAPAPDDLVGAARTRLRRRRRTRAAAVAAAAVVVVAVPAALTLREDAPGGHTAVDRGGLPAARAVPDGWRMVTDAGLSLLVPADWEPGTRSDWCAQGGRRPPDEPVVETSGMLHHDILCLEPQESLGVTIGSAQAVSPAYDSGHVWRYEQGTGPGPELYLDGSWLAYWYDDDHVVQANAADRETVERIVDSVDADWTTAEHEGVTVDLPPGWVELDQSGCRWPWPRFGPPDVDPCDPGAEGISFYGEATFDPATGPGLSRGDDGWSGYAYAGDFAVWVNVDDRATGRRILDSREPAR